MQWSKSLVAKEKKKKWNKDLDIKNKNHGCFSLFIDIECLLQHNKPHIIPKRSWWIINHNMGWYAYHPVPPFSLMRMFSIFWKSTICSTLHLKKKKKKHILSICHLTKKINKEEILIENSQKLCHHINFSFSFLEVLCC